MHDVPAFSQDVDGLLTARRVASWNALPLGTTVQSMSPCRRNREMFARVCAVSGACLGQPLGQSGTRCHVLHVAGVFAPISSF